MIYIRYKDARPLSAFFATKNNNFNFAKQILNAKVIDIIYFEDGIKSDTFFNEIGPTYKLMGQLEKKNVPFILLIDRGCEIQDSKSCVSVINANCISYEALEDSFLDGRKLTNKDNKSLLFYGVFNDFVEYNKPDSFSDNFYCFKRTGELEEFITKDVLFLAVSRENGLIYNGNPDLGVKYNEGKIWYYNEEYESKAIKTENKSNYSYSSVEEFCLLYETNKSHISSARISSYNEKELTEILKKYPKVFSDIIRTGYSYYNKDEILYENAPKNKTEEHAMYEIDDDCSIQEAVESYFNSKGDLPDGTQLCYSCDNYIIDNCMKNITNEGKMIAVCDDCMHGWS